MRRLLDLIEYGAVLLAELVIRCLPPTGARVFGRSAGTLWYALDRRRRRRATDSLGVAVRGGLEVPDIEALTLETCQGLGEMAVESLLFPRFFRTERQILDRCQFYGDFDRLRADVATGRGGLFVSGHLGNWEIAAATLRFLDAPSRVVMRPIENPLINQRIAESRGLGGDVILKAGAVREMVRTLERGGWVGILADQNAGRRGAFVPFFGLAASTYAAPAVLAVRAGVPMYAAACLRIPKALMRFEIHVVRLPDPPAGLREMEAVEFLLARFAATLEGWVRRAPGQYNWIHRRWKTRPEGEPASSALPGYAEVR